jgi:hypothetical protein
MELRVGQIARPYEVPILDALLAEFTVLPLDPQITQLAIDIRGNSLISGPKVKLPDAIIGGTAAAYGIPIVTRNPTDFSWSGIVVHIPYDYDSATGQVTTCARHSAISNPVPRSRAFADVLWINDPPLIAYER